MYIKILDKTMQGTEIYGKLSTSVEDGKKALKNKETD